MEFALGLVTGYLLTWPAIVVLCLLAIFMEHTEATGWAVFFGLAALVVSYFVFTIPLQTLLIAAGGYLVIGTLWSFWRYKRFVSAGAKEALKEYTVKDKERALENLRASKHLGKITSWLVIWPFSLIENLTGDIIELVQTAITEWFHNVYESIFRSSTGNAYDVIAQQRKAEEEAEEAKRKAAEAPAEEEITASVKAFREGTL